MFGEGFRRGSPSEGFAWSGARQLGPCHAPVCTAPSNAVSSAATSAYSMLSDEHAAAAANNGPGPGPLLSNAECTSGGEAIHTGAVTTVRGKLGATTPRAQPRSRCW